MSSIENSAEDTISRHEKEIGNLVAQVRRLIQGQEELVAEILKLQKKVQKLEGK